MFNSSLRICGTFDGYYWPVYFTVDGKNIDGTYSQWEPRTSYELYKFVRHRSKIVFYVRFFLCSLIFANQLTSCTNPICLLHPSSGRVALGPTHWSRWVHLTFLHIVNESTVSHPNQLFHLTLSYKVAMTYTTVIARKKSFVLSPVMTAWVS